MNKRKLTISGLTMAIAVLTSIAFAATFTYYPLGVTVSPTNPVVKFAAGSNAGSNDVAGFISVSVSRAGTNASIKVHPTYQVTYYKNVTLIQNTDLSKAWNIWLKVTQPITSFPSGSKVYLVIYSSGASRSLTGYPTPAPASGTYVANISLTSSSSPVNIGQLSAGGTYEVDIYVYIPEGSALPTSATAGVMLIATPSSETPP